MPQQVQRTRADTMAARVRLALAIAGPGVIPDRFREAYERGGTPTSVHRVAIAAAAGTTPIWLMTGWPAAHAPTASRTHEEQEATA